VPDNLRKAYFIFAPRWFSASWGVIRRVLHEDIAARIEIRSDGGGDSLAALLGGQGRVEEMWREAEARGYPPAPPPCPAATESRSKREEDSSGAGAGGGGGGGFGGGDSTTLLVTASIAASLLVAYKSDHLDWGLVAVGLQLGLAGVSLLLTSTLP